MIPDKLLLKIAIVSFIFSSIALFFIPASSQEDLMIINITKEYEANNKQFIQFSTVLDASGLSEVPVNTTGQHIAVLSKIGEDFYYVTNIRYFNGSIKTT